MRVCCGCAYPVSGRMGEGCGGGGVGCGSVLRHVRFGRGCRRTRRVQDQPRFKPHESSWLSAIDCGHCSYCTPASLALRCILPFSRFPLRGTLLSPPRASMVCSAALLVNLHDPVLSTFRPHRPRSHCASPACTTYLDEDRLHSLGESPAPLSRLLPLAGTDLRLLCRARTVPALVLSALPASRMHRIERLLVRPGGICPAYHSLRSACMALQRHPNRSRACHYSTRRRGGRSTRGPRQESYDVCLNYPRLNVKSHLITHCLNKCSTQ
ncbi:hypothetical protein B0H14DRAFT_636140 [Mycena olivaceomarginata]|nr:hypothetical protein B0H14DRAFT_636140 [Mycena olivaceomarginata]